jgi:hypothetical protein
VGLPPKVEAAVRKHVPEVRRRKRLLLGSPVIPLFILIFIFIILMYIIWLNFTSTYHSCPTFILIQGVGMLSVSSLVPGGPGHRAGLQPGDVLVSMKHVTKNKNQESSRKVVTLFPDFEEILDDLVRKCENERDREGDRESSTSKY